MAAPRYPGRQRVIARSDAASYVYDQHVKLLQQPQETICTAPVIIAAIGLPSAIIEAHKGPLPLEMHACCRKCPACLEHRRRLWTARALEEVNASERTWFGTLTIRPEDRFRLRMKAELNAKKRGWEPLDQMEPATAFKKIVDELNREVTLFFKRVRKESAAPLRYLLVAEKHKSGDPHLHLLLHERSVPVRKELLERQWPLGFSSWKLVQDGKSAFYVCKYLAKDAQTRVRASVKYGQPTQLMEALTERACEATRKAKAAAEARSLS